MTSSFILPNQAHQGFSDASSYDKHRPSYPPEAVEKLLVSLGVANQKNARIVELASGTGKFTESLAARHEQYEITAVEPHAGMRETLEKKNLGSKLRILDGSADNMPVEAEWGDALIAAQAFHWFATEKSLDEISRVLRPAAAFGMIWNVEDYNSPREWPIGSKWVQVLKDIVSELGDGLPRFRDLEWKKVFEKQLDTTPLQTIKDTFQGHLPKFSLPLGEDTFKWTVWLEDEAVWSRYATLSQIANLEGDQKEKTKLKVLEALKNDSTERNERGEVAVRGVTYLAWTSRI